MTENEYSSIAKGVIDKPGGVFECLTYVARPGRLGDLNARFRDHTVALFEKHGMRSIGYWTPFDTPASENTLIYLIHHRDRKQAGANWEAFRGDPEWREVSRRSEIGGKLLASPPESTLLKSPFSLQSDEVW